LEHFFIRDLVHAVSLGDHARIGRVNAVHIGVDVATFGTDAGGNRTRRRVGPAAAKGGYPPGVPMHALEPGNDRDLAMVLEALDNFGAVHTKNATAPGACA